MADHQGGDSVHRSRSLASKLLAASLAAIGILLLLGGGYLLFLGGSAYYVLAGGGLIASGHFLYRGRFLGALVYLGVFLVTFIWTLWEVDGSAWELVPRLVGPTILLLATLLVAPSLSGTRMTRSASLISTAVVALGMTGLFAAYGSGVVTGTLRISDAGTGMSDPSLLPVAADWPAYGGSYAAQRYSPLKQINAGNVGDLKLAWTYHTLDLPEDLKHNKYGAETTPLMVDNTLFLCSAKNILIALDPGTGKEKWRYNPGVSDDFIPYTAACRGVTYFRKSSTAAAPEGSGALSSSSQPDPGRGQPPKGSASPACETRIIEGTLDGRIIAVDSKTGKPCPDFGTNGQVSITVGMGHVDPGIVAITSAPVIINGVIVTGHQVKDNIERDAPSGVIQGFDAVTGKHLWAWDMNRPGQTGIPTGEETYSRGTPNMWTTASGDEQLGLVYLPMGNAAADYVSAHRTPAELTYTAALVAIDARTGVPRWHFRTVDNDVWDYDLGSQATLIDFPIAGGTTPALVLPSKQGDIYILDRATGKPLTKVDRRSVPQGGAEASRRSKTQPFSAYHTLAKPMLRERDMWGMTPIDQMICRIQYRSAAYEGMYTPPRLGQHSVQYPGYNGGSDWGGISVDPVHRMIVANYNDMPNYVRLLGANDQAEVIRQQKLEKEKPALKKAGGGVNEYGPQKGTPYAVEVNPGWRLPWTGLPCKEPPYGGLRAIDIATGETIWDRPFGSARKNGPWGLSLYLPFTIGTPNNGGTLITAGGLIFAGATTDDLFRAMDERTGKTLWSTTLPAGGQATPMTYEYEGRQYVVMMAGGHHFMKTAIGDALVAYALPNRRGEIS